MHNEIPHNRQNNSTTHTHIHSVDSTRKHFERSICFFYGAQSRILWGVQKKCFALLSVRNSIFLPFVSIVMQLWQSYCCYTQLSPPFRSSLSLIVQTREWAWFWKSPTWNKQAAIILWILLVLVAIHVPFCAKYIFEITPGSMYINWQPKAFSCI